MLLLNAGIVAAAATGVAGVAASAAPGLVRGLLLSAVGVAAIAACPSDCVLQVATAVVAASEAVVAAACWAGMFAAVFADSAPGEEVDVAAARKTRPVAAVGVDASRLYSVCAPACSAAVLVVKQFADIQLCCCPKFQAFAEGVLTPILYIRLLCRIEVLVAVGLQTAATRSATDNLQCVPVAKGQLPTVMACHAAVGRLSRLHEQT